jgi:hypothetical protein
MPSLYGKGLYGKGLYSRVPNDLVGDLAPAITFSANLTVVRLVNLVGDLRPLVALGASLTADRVFRGGLTSQVVLVGQMASGPLWEASEPGAPPWSPSESCPPSLWTPSPPCTVDWEESELCNG